MPEEEAIKCPSCSNDVASDEILHSTSAHGDICSDCYDDVWTCSNCSEEQLDNGDKVVDINGDDVCQSCISNNYNYCEASSEYFNPDTEEYFSYGGTIVHGNYASDYEADQCCNCGTDVYMSEVYSEHWEDEQQCYDCYNTRDECLSNIAKIGRDITVLLDKHYKKVGANAVDDASKQIERELYKFKDSFYDSYNNYDYNDLYLLKSHIGYGRSYGFWKSKMTVQSEHFQTFAKFLRDMITNNLFIVEHKKYGLYHPLRDIFKSCLRYYDKETTKIREGDSIPLEQMGKEWIRFSVDYLSKAKLLKMLVDNKTDDGANLRKLINNVFNRSYKYRLTGYYPEDHNFWTIEQKYKTNSSGIKLPVRLGFDAKMMKEFAKFNAQVGSCQVASNNESYAFGMMDMVTNPHLMLLIYDEKDEYVIGRSVIKFYKEKNQWGKPNSCTYVAPSRLYLTEHTQAKRDIYCSMFKLVNKFASETFKDYKILCHKHSRHDSSVYSYVNESTEFKFTNFEDRKQLFSDCWLPYWTQKPSSDEAEFTYYQDESATVTAYRISDSVNSTYAMQERISAYEITQIEVKQQENEQ